MGAGNGRKLLYIFKDSSCNITSMSGPYGTGALKKKAGTPHSVLSYNYFGFASYKLSLDLSPLFPLAQ